MPWWLVRQILFAPSGEGGGAAAAAAASAAGAGAPAGAGAGAAPGAAPVGGAAGSGGQSPPGQAGGGAPAAGQRPDMPGWMGQLSEQRRAALANHGFDSVDKLADNFLRLEGEAGKDRLLIPGENATPEQLGAWRKGIGVPEKPEGYELPSEGVDDKFVSFVRGAAHKHGIPASAMKAFAADWQGYVQQHMKGLDDSAKAAAADDDAKLRTEWKGDYDRNKAAVDRLGVYLGWSSDTIGAVARAEGYSKGMNGLLKLADLIAEDGNHPTGSGHTFNITNATEARAELDRMKADPAVGTALRDGNHPQHKTVQAKWDRLQEIAVGIRGPQAPGGR